MSTNEIVMVNEECGQHAIEMGERNDGNRPEPVTYEYVRTLFEQGIGWSGIAKKINEHFLMPTEEDGHKAITFEDIEKALNEVGFEIVKFDMKYAEQWTETSEEDWILNLYGDTPEVMAKHLIDEYENFDIDEDVELFIPSRGKNGVPNSIRVLVANAEEKDKKLGRLSEILRSMLLK